MYRLLLAALAYVLSLQSAHAQPTNADIVANYRAYRAAYDAGDYVSAERHAEAAMNAASRSADERTGVLAMNLAVVRALKLGRLSEAERPAQMALDAGGVDPLQARALVMLSNAGSRSHDGAALSATLNELLAQEEPPAGFVYDVAIAWGNEELSERHHAQSERAFEIAVRASDLGLSNAEIASVNSVRGMVQVELGQLGAARASLDRAAVLLTPMAPENAAETAPAAEIALARTLVWRALAGIQAGENLAGVAQRPGVEPGLCTGVLDAPMEMRFNAGTIRGDHHIAAVRLTVNEDGDVLRYQVLASAPDETMQRNLTGEDMSNWSMAWSDKEPGCRRSSGDVLYILVTTIRTSLRR